MGVEHAAARLTRENTSQLSAGVFAFANTYYRHIDSRIPAAEPLFGNILPLPTQIASSDSISLDKRSYFAYLLTRIEIVGVLGSYYRGELPVPPANTDKEGGMICVGIAQQERIRPMFQEVDYLSITTSAIGQLLVSFPIIDVVRPIPAPTQTVPGMKEASLYRPGVRLEFTNSANPQFQSFGGLPSSHISFLPPLVSDDMSVGAVQVAVDNSKNHVIIPGNVLYLLMRAPLLVSTDTGIQIDDNDFTIGVYVEGFYSESYENLIPYLSI